MGAPWWLVTLLNKPQLQAYFRMRALQVPGTRIEESQCWNRRLTAA